MNNLAKFGIFLAGLGLCAQAAMQFLAVAVSAGALSDLTKNSLL